ncbi:MAG: hypothetical protein ABI113_22145 [Mucilaginibacter sp.]
MTAIEQQQLKGITIKNLLVTIVSTASIVASVMTTYFGLKADIAAIKSSQETEARINNIRIKVLEDRVTLLQKQISEIGYSGKLKQPQTTNSSRVKIADAALFTATKLK